MKKFVSHTKLKYYKCLLEGSPAYFSTLTPPQNCHSACATPPSDRNGAGSKHMQINE